MYDGSKPDGGRGGQNAGSEEQLRVATWNIGSMSGRSGEVVEAMAWRRIHICCLQETRWKGEGARWLGQKGRRYKFMWQGRTDGNSDSGVGVLVAEDWTDKIVSINRHGDRLVVVKAVAGKRLLNFISTYAPQSGRSAQEKEEYWENITQTVNSIPQQEGIILGGDLNGHIGESIDGYEGTHGGFGYGTRNVEGEKVLEFAVATNTVLCNTFFKKDKEKLVTYSSGGRKSAIDFIMVRRADRTTVKNVMVIASEECVQQHRLVVAVLNLKSFKKKKTVFTPRLRVWKLKDRDSMSEYETLLAKANEEVNSKSGPEDRWNAMKGAWLSAADQVCGWTKGPPRHRETWWWNEEVAEAVEEKRALYSVWKRTGIEGDHQRYIEAKKRARNAVWRAKECKREELTRDLSGTEGQKKVFKIAKQMAKEQVDIEGACCMKNEEGIISTGCEEIKSIWKTYFEKLLNVENDWDQDTNADIKQGPQCEITHEEVTKAVKATAVGKAGGPTGVVTEMLRAGGEQSVKWLTTLFNDITAKGEIPSDWSKSILVPLYKGKGDPMACGSYRAIKLLEQTMKIYERVLEKRIRSQVDINEMQFGFMPGKGTTDAIFIIRQLQEKHQQKKKDLYYAFVDLEKAFDRVPREVVRWSLRKLGVEEWLVVAVMALFQNASTAVKTSGGFSEDLEVKVGVHQGSVLSPLLFAAVMDVASSEAREGLPWELLYADDLVLIASSREELSLKLQAWKTGLTNKGLKVNTGKTNVMKSSHSRSPTTVPSAYPCGVCGKGVATNSILCTSCLKWVHRRCSGIKGSLTTASPTFTCSRCSNPTPQAEHTQMTGLSIDGEEYKAVSSFCYLGDMLDAEGGVKLAVTTRIRCGWKKFRELAPFLTSKAPTPKLKGMVYAACVRTSMIYGSETWAITTEDSKRLERAEAQMVRWMSGVTLKDRKRTSEVLQSLGLDSITMVITKARLRWYGHVQRKSPEDWVKKVTSLTVDGRRPPGRPQRTWQELLASNLTELQIRPADAADRDRWRRAIDGIPSNLGPPRKRTLNRR